MGSNQTKAQIWETEMGEEAHSQDQAAEGLQTVDFVPLVGVQHTSLHPMQGIMSATCWCLSGASSVSML